MLLVKGIYKLPEIRHIFIVVPSASIANDNPKLLLRNKERREYFERTVLSKDRMTKLTSLKWTIRIIREDDFLMSVGELTKRPEVSSNPSFDNPESMELLAINLLKTPLSSPDLSLHTPKVLSKVLDEDIIEVFI